MEMGMAAKEDGENASQEGDQRIIDLALQAFYEGTRNGKWSFGKGQNCGKGGKDEEKNSWQKGSGKTGGKGQEKGGKGEIQNVLDVRQDRTHCSLVQKRRKQKPVRHGRR